MSGKVTAKEDILPIYGTTPFTLLDFPDRTACIIWFSGCNMRCGYCHNPEIVKGRGQYDIGKVLSFLERRKYVLDGVVLSGGEASSYPGLPAFIRKIKSMGYAVKLDTNGIRPDLLEVFLKDGLLDYVALDYKAPVDKFKAVTGVKKFGFFSDTLDMLCRQKNIPFEVRTTVHTSLLDEEDIITIMRDLELRGYKGDYYVQNFCADNNRPTLGNIPPQKRLLNINALPRPADYRLHFRNFAAVSAA
ncbi:MAG: anaerobic ribonucleoside-triphosphate reductase activating protein [Pseudomonadota bacterium]|nr:anaerobic ribonucleoside-triphosphate reductase activating protein [Pseudomonadota bacterium]QKK06214.1 MAG: anaerobic ribonucleoside-triphosphate reductase activating protein [Pseudomonadota bacterium]